MTGEEAVLICKPVSNIHQRIRNLIVKVALKNSLIL